MKMDIKDITGPRDGHTFRKNFLKNFCNLKHGYIEREELNINRTTKDDAEKVNKIVQRYWDDGMYTPSSGNANKNNECTHYSLNKHRRWEIPAIVQNVLHKVSQENFRVVLCERKIPATKIRSLDYDYYFNDTVFQWHINTWKDCISYTDSKGTLRTHIVPKRVSSFYDLRRMCNRIEGPQREKRPRKHNLHWRGCQRKTLPDGRHRRQDRTHGTKVRNYVIRHGHDNPDDCPEIRYEIGHPIHPYSRLKIPHNIGCYAIERKVPHYRNRIYLPRKRKALKKTKRRRNRYTSKLFLDGNYHEQLKTELIEYEEESMSQGSCMYQYARQDCGCGWPKVDYCSCLVDHVDSECEVDSRHLNTSHTEQLRSFSLSVDLSSVIKNKISKRKRRKKEQTGSHLHMTHPNSAMSNCVSKWFGKGEYILCKSEDQVNEVRQTDNKSENSDSGSISTTSHIENFPDCNVPDLICKIKRKSLTDRIMMGDCRMGHAFPLRCSFQLNKGFGNDERSISLSILEKTVSSQQHLDIGDYVLRIHNSKGEFIKAVTANMQQSLLENDTEVYNMADILCMGRAAVQKATTAKQQHISTRNNKDVTLSARLSENLLVSKDTIYEFKIPRLDLIGRLMGHHSHFQIKSVREASAFLENNMPNDIVDLPIVPSDIDIHLCLKEAMCDICVLSYEDDVEFTVLMPCRHAFCNNCLSQYIMERVKNGAKKIECLEHNCPTAVDHTTISSLIPSTVFHKWIQRNLEIVVESCGKWKWCPNNYCDKVVAAPSDGVLQSTKDTTVHCTCSELWCLDCQFEAHWPATCAQAENYVKILRESGHTDGFDEDKTSFVNVKRCPTCQHPIEKNGGCPHMVCRCGETFCWNCLTPWHRHEFTDIGLDCKTEVTETTMVLNSAKNSSLFHEYYLECVRHRKRAIEGRDSILLQEAMKIVKNFDLRDKIMCRTGWRKVWNQETDRYDLYQHVLHNLLVIKECHRFLERVYIVLSHSTGQKVMRKLLQKVLTTGEFILEQFRKISKERSSPEVFQRHQKLEGLLYSNMQLILTQCRYLQNLMKKDTQFSKNSQGFKNI